MIACPLTHWRCTEEMLALDCIDIIQSIGLTFSTSSEQNFCFRKVTSLGVVKRDPGWPGKKDGNLVMIT